MSHSIQSYIFSHVEILRNSLNRVISTIQKDATCSCANLQGGGLDNDHDGNKESWPSSNFDFRDLGLEDHHNVQWSWASWWSDIMILIEIITQWFWAPLPVSSVDPALTCLPVSWQILLTMWACKYCQKIDWILQCSQYLHAKSTNKII